MLSLLLDRHFWKLSQQDPNQAFFNIKIWFKHVPGPFGLHFHPFSAQTEPRRPISGKILTKLPTVHFNKDLIFRISDDLDLIFWISDDFDKPKKMRNVRTIIFHVRSFSTHFRAEISVMCQKTQVSVFSKEAHLWKSFRGLRPCMIVSADTK